MMRFFLHLNSTTGKLLVMKKSQSSSFNTQLLLGRVAKEEMLKSKLSSHVLGKVKIRLLAKT